MRATEVLRKIINEENVSKAAEKMGADPYEAILLFRRMQANIDRVLQLDDKEYNEQDEELREQKKISRKLKEFKRRQRKSKKGY